MGSAPHVLASKVRGSWRGDLQALCLGRRRGCGMRILPKNCEEAPVKDVLG